MINELGYTYTINNISAAFSQRLLKFVLGTISNDKGHDQLSMSQLCKEKHSDPVISSIYDRALDDDEMLQVPVCLYVKKDI